MGKSAKVMTVGAGVFVGGLVIVVGGNLIGIASFDRATEPGNPSLEGASEGIVKVLFSTVVGTPIAVVGFCLLLGGLIAYFIGKRESRGEGRSTESY